MELDTCQSCAHFRQHYILDEQSCTPVNCGHCTYPRLKHRLPASCSCKHYKKIAEQPPLPDRKQVIHYLTTDLLRFILSLELPPEIAAEDEGFDLHFCPEDKN